MNYCKLIAVVIIASTLKASAQNKLNGDSTNTRKINGRYTDVLSHLRPMVNNEDSDEKNPLYGMDVKNIPQNLTSAIVQLQSGN